MTDFNEIFVEYVLPILATGIAALAAFALKSLVSFLEAKAQSSKIAAAGVKIAHFAEIVVADLEATVKPQLAGMVADGHITDEEKKTLKDLAMSRLKQLLSEHGLDSLSGVLGIATSKVQLYLSGVIEKALNTVKAEEAQSPK